MGFVAAVGAEEQPPAVVQPGEGAFDDPAVASEPRAVRRLPSCNHWLDAALPDQTTVLVVVVAAIGNDAVRPPTRPADTATYRWYPVE